MDNFHKFDVLHFGGDKHIDAERRRDSTHAKIHQNDAGQLHLINAVSISYRGKQRHKQQDGRITVDEHTANQEDNVHNQHEHNGGTDVSSHPYHQLLGHAGEGNGLTGNVGRGHDKHNYTGKADGELHHVHHAAADRQRIGPLADDIVGHTGRK